MKPKRQLQKIIQDQTYKVLGPGDFDSMPSPRRLAMPFSDSSTWRRYTCSGSIRISFGSSIRAAGKHQYFIRKHNNAFESKSEVARYKWLLALPARQRIDLVATLQKYSIALYQLVLFAPLSIGAVR